MKKETAINLIEVCSNGKAKVLSHMVSNIKDGHFHGTVREIAKDTGVTTPTVLSTMDELKKRGMLELVRSGTYRLFI